MNNKTLALLRNAYDDNHGWIITVEDKDRPTYKFKYRMREVSQSMETF